MSKRMAILLTVFLLASITIAAAAGRRSNETAGSSKPALDRQLRNAATHERVYEIPPNLRVNPISRPLYCSDLDCGDDSDLRCIQRGHGDAADHSFHFSRDGSGNCLITCSDGYMLLVVDDGCSTADDSEPVTSRRWPPRSREIWVAPRGADCVDPHEIGRDAPICETSND